ncbi:hypothetical protein ACLOJK_037193 [Asimina triloba]
MGGGIATVVRLLIVDAARRQLLPSATAAMSSACSSLRRKKEIPPLPMFRPTPPSSSICPEATAPLSASARTPLPATVRRLLPASATSPGFGMGKRPCCPLPRPAALSLPLLGSGPTSHAPFSSSPDLVEMGFWGR